MAFTAGAVTPPAGWVVLFGGGNDGEKRRLSSSPTTPALGTRLAWDAGLSGLILTVEGPQREVEAGAAAEAGAVALVAPGGEVEVLSS